MATKRELEIVQQAFIRSSGWRVGIVGCGRIARRHVEVIASEVKELSIIGLCDIDIRKAESLAKLYKEIRPSEGWSSYDEAFACYDSLDDMLKTCLIEILIVATPSGLHLEHASKGMAAECSVIVEKPFAFDYKDAYDLFINNRYRDRFFFGVLQNRFNPIIQRVVKAVKEGEIGDLYLVNLNILWNRNDDYYKNSDWHGTKKLDGGILYNQGIHYIDLLYMCVGDIKDISSKGKTLARSIEFPDTIVAHFETESGALGVLSATVLAEPSSLESSLTLMGSKGVIRLGGVTCDEVQVWRTETSDGIPDDLKELIEAPSSESESYNSERWGRGHLPFYRYVVETIKWRLDEELNPDYYDICKTIMLVQRFSSVDEPSEAS